MSYRTTAVLLVVLVALGAYVYFSGSGSNDPDVTGADDLLVLNLDDASIDSVEVREANSVVLARKNAGGSWELVEPEQTEGDQSRLGNVTYAIAQLRATRVVAASSDDLATYGLDRPQAEAIIGTGGDRTRLLIGNQNPAGSGSYLKRSDSDTIYLVGSYAINQLRGLINDPPKPKPTPTPTLAPSQTPVG